WAVLVRRASDDWARGLLDMGIRQESIGIVSACYDAVSNFAKYGSTSGANAGCVRSLAKWAKVRGNSLSILAWRIGVRPFFSIFSGPLFSLKKRLSSAAKQMSAIVRLSPTKNSRSGDKAW